jgi:hypothetical protein
MIGKRGDISPLNLMVATFMKGKPKLDGNSGRIKMYAGACSKTP